MRPIGRFGQTKPVEVIRFVVEDTIEPAILKIQDAKEKLAGAFHLTPAQMKDFRLENYREMFYQVHWQYATGPEGGPAVLRRVVCHRRAGRKAWSPPPARFGRRPP